MEEGKAFLEAAIQLSLEQMAFLLEVGSRAYRSDQEEMGKEAFRDRQLCMSVLHRA